MSVLSLCRLSAVVVACAIFLTSSPLLAVEEKTAPIEIDAEDAPEEKSSRRRPVGTRAETISSSSSKEQKLAPKTIEADTESDRAKNPSRRTPVGVKATKNLQDKVVQSSERKVVDVPEEKSRVESASKRRPVQSSERADSRSAVQIDKAIDDEEVVKPREKTLSFNLNPLGILLGRFSANSMILKGAHGVFIEPSFLFDFSSAGGGGYGVGLAVGHRWHWSGVQDSGFLGTHLGGDVMYVSGHGYRFSVNTFRVVWSIGRRFAMDSFNITARVGAGPQYGTVVGGVPGGYVAVEALGLAFEGELSFGWMFD